MTGAMSKGGGSPSTRRQPRDEEEGGDGGFLDEDEDPFDIASTKNVPLDRLRRWRVRNLALFT